ncbi:Cytosolic copper metallochaperone [Podila epicladia]|nr:Cytosolic copper metallochaperone [Podila epicladia]
MTTFVYDVTMTCSGCSGAVTRVLNKLQGVDKFDVSLETQKVTVESATLSQVRIDHEQEVFDRH